MKLLWVLTFIFVCTTAKAAEQVEFATHYDYPPFVIDMKKQEGFVFDLAKYLSKQSKGRYDFQVTYVPRVRIENYLSKKKTVVVPFVSPKWFSDDNMNRYLWTDPLMKDQNVVVMQAKSFEYKGLDSLTGKTIAYFLGHKIPALEPLISDGKIKREDGPSMIGNFRKVVEGRADFLVTGETVVRYIIEREHWQANLSIAKEPIDVFERRILISPITDTALQQWINSEIKALIKSNQWPTWLEHYNFEKLSTSAPTQSSTRH